MPEGRRPRGVTPRPRSGAMTKSARLQGTGTAERSYPESKVRGSSWEELPHAPKPEARGGSQEDQPHAQGKSHGYAGTRGPRGAIPL